MKRFAILSVVFALAAGMVVGAALAADQTRLRLQDPTCDQVQDQDQLQQRLQDGTCDRDCVCDPLCPNCDGECVGDCCQSQYQYQGENPDDDWGMFMRQLGVWW